MTALPRAQIAALLFATAIGPTACFLPSEPSGADPVTFVFDVEPPYRVPLAGSIEPPIQIAADGRVLQGAAYRLESLNTSLVRIDETGRGLQGVERGSASVRALYQSVTGTRDTVFAVLVVVSRVAVHPPALAFTKLGDRTSVRATAYDAKDAPVPKVAFTWSSADPPVATVDNTGLVTAVDEGTSVITAEADGVSDSSDVTVTQVAAVVLVTPGLDTLRTVKRSVQFIAQAWDSSGSALRTARPRWSSSDTSVAQVHERSGLATARGGGTSWIIARVANAADTATLVVSQVIAYVRVTPGYDTLTAIADTTRFAVLAADSGDTAVPNASVAWATSDPTVATVDQTGLARAAKNGVVLVSASAGGLSAFATLIVQQEFARAQVSPDHVELSGSGATIQLNAVGLDRNGYPVPGTRFGWATASRCVATVDAQQLPPFASAAVTARGTGETAISVVAADPITGLAVGQPDTAVVNVTGAPSSEPEIAYEGSRGIMAICGSDETTTLVLDPGSLFRPAWSPDGTRIAFARYEGPSETGSDFRCYTARADGSDVRRISDIGCDDPAWSPDGERIAFTSPNTAAWGHSIYIVSADGSNLRWLGGNTDDRWSNPTWSPDGARLAFTRWVSPPAHCCGVITFVNADGTGLISTGVRAANPAWSPDGSQIAFDDFSSIRVINADGSGETVLTTAAAADPECPNSEGYVFKPAWSPDGAQIVHVVMVTFCGVGQRTGLSIINRDGTAATRPGVPAERGDAPRSASWRRIPP